MSASSPAWRVTVANEALCAVASKIAGSKSLAGAALRRVSVGLVGRLTDRKVFIVPSRVGLDERKPRSGPWEADVNRLGAG